MNERKPIAILKLIVLSNGVNISFQVERNPRMSDEDMMTIVESLYLQLKNKYGKKTD